MSIFITYIYPYIIRGGEINDSKFKTRLQFYIMFYNIYRNMYIFYIMLKRKQER